MPDNLSTSFSLAEAPFDKSSADLILRSSDGTDFRVRRGVLAEASSIFEDMFTLPQPIPDKNAINGDDISQDPIVFLSEPSRTLDYLLRFCYPIPNPTLPTIDDVFSVLEAAHKYMMDDVVTEVRRQFCWHGERDPLRMYALACARGWPEEMRIAARASLTIPLSYVHDVEELEKISAGAYLRLQTYHRECSTLR